MRYTVIYRPPVEQELARLWMQAPDPDELSRASNLIDRILKFAPEMYGQVSGPYRLLTVGPLTVAYTVDRGDCKVEVVDIAFNP
jgi:hypothetical protein